MTSPIMPDHIYSLTGVSDPSLSPDGTRLAYTLSWVDQEQLDGRSRIMMLDLGSEHTHQFTQGTKDSAPRFSPDGRTLAFLRADGQGHRQAWLMPAAGGEAQALAAWSRRGPGSPATRGPTRAGRTAARKHARRPVS